MEKKPKFYKEEAAIDFLKGIPGTALIKAWDMEDPREFIFSEINNWFYMALCNEKGIYNKVSAEERATFVEFFADLLQLLEVVFACRVRELFLDKHDRMPEGKELDQASFDYFGFAYSYLFIGVDEREQPLIIVKSFCNKYRIEYARRELWDLYQSAQTYEGVFRDRITLHDFPANYLKLSIIMEACYRLTFKVRTDDTCL